MFADFEKDSNGEMIKGKNGFSVPTIESILHPDHPVAAVLKYIYVMECFLYSSLNTAQRTKDYSKVKTLGAYSRVF